MPDLYDLSREIGIKELTLSAGRISKDGENLLVLGNKPEVLKNKEISLRYANSRDWSFSKPEAFFAEAGVFNERELKTSWSVLARDGWSFKTRTDPDGNKTSKNYYVRIENKNSNQVYIGVPVTKYHFGAGQDPILDDLLIIDEQSFLDNPNFAMSLNHQKVNVENENGHWTVAKDDPLAGIIKLPGNTIAANNPEEIYLLTETELDQYNSSGARKGWREDSSKIGGLRSFVKKEFKNGLDSTIDRRFAKEIMIPQMVNGKEENVKHFLLSDQKTLESLEIMAPKSKEEESIIQENVDDPGPEVELSAAEVASLTNPIGYTFDPDNSVPDEEMFESQTKEVVQSEAEQKNKTATQGEVEIQDFPFDAADPGDYSGNEERFGPEVQSAPESLSSPVKQNVSESQSVAKMPIASEKKKAEYTGLAKEIADRIASMNGGTISPSEKAFLDDLNLIQDDPQKVKVALASIQHSPDHINIIKQFMISGNAEEANEKNQDKPKDKTSSPEASPSSMKVGGAEAAFGAAAGLTAGFVKGVGSVAGAAVTGTLGLGGDIVKGTLSEINNIINNHHKRKLYRLEHPEVVEQEKVAKKEKLKATRQAVAEDSNRILDAKIESVLASKQYIDQNPAVQQMYDMIDNDPTQKKNLEGWLEDTAAGNPVFAEHLKNIQENAGDVARSMEENLKVNNLADGDLQARKTVFEKFSEKFANDSLADVLPDTGNKVSDGEQQTSIRESITKAINTIMKMLKDMMLVLLGKKKIVQDDSVDQRGDTAPAMSR